MDESIIRIPLPSGQCAVIDAADAPLVANYSWHSHRPKHQLTTYASAYVRGSGAASKRQVLMHRVIMDVGAGQRIDHADGDGLNNRRSNLRLATQRQNVGNTGLRRNNTSGYKGVVKEDNRWVAQLMMNRRHVVVGRFATAEEAARAYDAAAIKHFGREFAWLNFPNEEAA